MKKRDGLRRARALNHLYILCRRKIVRFPPVCQARRDQCPVLQIFHPVRCSHYQRGLCPHSQPQPLTATATRHLDCTARRVLAQFASTRGRWGRHWIPLCPATAFQPFDIMFSFRKVTPFVGCEKYEDLGATVRFYLPYVYIAQAEQWCLPAALTPSSARPDAPHAGSG